MRHLTVLVLSTLVGGALGAAPQDGSSGLTLQVIEGQNAINNISRNAAYEPVVEVKNSEGKPVPGASVSFVLPTIGPGALFPDGTRELMVQTDATGRAVGRGLRPNNQVGQFEIRVVASHNGARASTIVTQTNAAPVVTGSRSGRKLAIILGLVGGGAAAALAAASGGGSGGGNTSTGPPPPSGDAVTGTITPGTPGFGPPR